MWFNTEVVLTDSSWARIVEPCARVILRVRRYKQTRDEVHGQLYGTQYRYRNYPMASSGPPLGCLVPEIGQRRVGPAFSIKIEGNVNRGAMYVQHLHLHNGVQPASQRDLPTCSIFSGDSME